MSEVTPDRTRDTPQGGAYGPLFRKYLVLIVTVIAVPLLANGAYEIWSSYRQHKDFLIRLQQGQAAAAAEKIA